jgi:diguanylate cyclase (GGDEF)-like protein/PAS domain S-box-containing protein
MKTRRGGIAETVRSLPSRAVVFVVFVCLSLAAMEAWREWTAYQSEIKDAETQSFNLAQSLAQHADDTFEIVDTVLLEIVKRVETDGMSPAALNRLTGILGARVAQQPRLQGLLIYDETGRWQSNSLNQFPEDLNSSARDYFQYHLKSRNTGPHLGPPIRNRSGIGWSVTVSRRLQHADGRFAGVALATLGADFFSDFYRQFNIGQDGSIALIQTTGTAVARFPYDDTFIGRDLSGAALIRGLGTAPDGVRSFTSPIDGMDRISGHKSAARFPLLVQVAVGRDEVLSAWREEALYRAGAVSLLTILIGATGLRLAGQVRLRQRTEAALAQSEADFRLLAENSSDMVVRMGGDGRRRYVSPAAKRLLGYEPAELEDGSIFDMVHVDDREQVARALDTMRSGEHRESTITFRSRHKDGSQVWLEASLRVAEDPDTGLPDGLVAVSRDISERKRLEEELTTLARTDGLTGLANRRTFDTALGLEARRASRQSMALSLILIDVDRFKIYNDSFGHVAGDECLRCVAGAIAGIVGRSGDLVARYGGEEFVLLLPATDATAALMVAERARLAVAALAIPHGANGPSGVVTISAGVATGTATPEVSEIDRAWLVEAADAALYLAKAEGRNRSVAAPQRLTDDACRQVA